MNQASHGAGHFGGMGRDHEMRGACSTTVGPAPQSS